MKGRKPGCKSMIWNIRKKKTKQKKKKKKKVKKKAPKAKDSISSLWDNFQRSNIHIIAMPGGEEKEQEFGNLLENIMKENFPNLVKEIDMQVQEAESPKQDGCNEAYSKTHHN